MSALKERKWILIVDDEIEIRSMLKEMIEITFGEGVSIVQAKDGVEATNKINCQLFHCIITDLRMPRKEGPAFINSIRQNTFNEATPVIIISGDESIVDVEKDFSFVQFIPKPFSFETMSEALKTQLKIGDNSKRVSADVFNNLIDATKQFIENITKVNAQALGLLSIKPIGSEVSQELVSSILVQMGKVSNTFSLLMERKEIENLISTNENLKQKTAEQVMNSMSYVILKHVMDQSGSIRREEFKANSINNDRSVLKDKSGLSILLGNQHLKVGIFATTK